MTCKERIVAFLREQRVPFTFHRHPSAYTAHDLAAYEQHPGRLAAKVVVVFLDSRMALLVLPADARADLGLVAEVTGAREITLAGEPELVAAFPDCDPGAMPAFGNLYGLPVYLDRALAQSDQLVFPAGTHEEVVCLGYADFFRLVRPTVAPFQLDVHAAGGSYEPALRLAAPADERAAAQAAR